MSQGKLFQSLTFIPALTNHNGHALAWQYAVIDCNCEVCFVSNRDSGTKAKQNDDLWMG